MFPSQRSLTRAVVFVGKGLHTGRVVRMEVHPASPNYGIRFLRTDSESAETIPALYNHISATELCTTIGSGVNSVATIEHLMAALAGLGIDNALVRLNGPEVPIMDGSSLCFVNEFLKVGFVEFAEKKKVLRVKERFEFESRGRTIVIEPAKETTIHCEIDFGKGIIGHQSMSMRFGLNSFLKISNARTFCHANEISALRSMGFAQGGSLENAVVVDDERVLNEEGLRGNDEFVRHKLLDFIGDMSLLGSTIVGKITVKKPGHGFHAEVMTQLMRQKQRYFHTNEAASDSAEDSVFALVSAAY